MGNAESQLPSQTNQVKQTYHVHNSSVNSDQSSNGIFRNQQQIDLSDFDASPYISEEISQQDVINIRSVFESLRDENDRPNEVKLSKLQLFPFFNKSDLQRFPKENDKAMMIQVKDGEFKDADPSYDPFTGRNIANYHDELNNSGPQQNANRGGGVKMENKGIDCQSIMCGCNNPKQSMMQIKGIRERGITFDQFFEIMSEKIKDQRFHSNMNIVFENKESNVSCFLWPLFGHQQS